MSGFFNMGSLALGVMAWIIAYIGLCKKRKNSVYPVSSFTCCCVSLLLQLCEINHRSDIGDYCAIEDTIEAIIYAAAVLIAVTFLLNFLSFFLGRKQ